MVSGRDFDGWWRQARRRQPDLLTFTPEDLLRDGGDELDEDAFPAEWHQGGFTLGLSYAFEPGSTEDGVAVHIPVAVLNQISPVGFDWQVPGLREELVRELIRSLPKAQRRAPGAHPRHGPGLPGRTSSPADEPLLEALAAELTRVGGERVSPGDFDVASLAPHLRLGFVVEGDDGEHAGLRRRPGRG